MNSLTQLRKWLADHLVETLGIGLFVVAMIVIFGGYFYSRYWHEIVKLTFPDFAQEMFSNFGTELFSIAVTILVVDYLNRRRQKTELKRQLIRQLGSRSNDFALFAADELREHGWLEDGSLRGAYLSEANLRGANLRDANLEGAKLYKANLQGARLTQANLTKTSLWLANLSGASMLAANLENANLSEANLENACLVDVTLRGAALQGATLQGATLEGAYLGEANLQRANMEVSSDIYETTISDAKYDNKTTWPEGFDPKAAGAINVDEPN